jgi:hypothetical protein
MLSPEASGAHGEDNYESIIRLVWLSRWNLASKRRNSTREKSCTDSISNSILIAIDMPMERASAGLVWLLLAAGKGTG